MATPRASAQIQVSAPDDPTAKRGHRTVNGHKAISLCAFAGSRGGEVVARRPWPTDVFLQGGVNGVVFAKSGNYETAFVEAHAEVSGFIRGEGATWQDAEDDAFEKFIKARNCSEHVWERRGYRNGGGICAKCGRFGSNVFDLAEIGSLCKVCGTPTYWHVEGDDLYCPEHTPHSEPAWLCYCPTCSASRKAERETEAATDV